MLNVLLLPKVLPSSGEGSTWPTFGTGPTFRRSYLLDFIPIYMVFGGKTVPMFGDFETWRHVWD